MMEAVLRVVIVDSSGVNSLVEQENHIPLREHGTGKGGVLSKETLNIFEGTIRKMGWEIADNEDPFGDIHDFDIVASKKVLTVTYYLLLNYIRNFESAHDVAEQKRLIIRIKDKAQSRFLGKMFIYCIVGDEIPDDVVILLDYKKILLSDWKKSGGGFILFIDLKTKRCFGNVPILPLPAKKLGDELVRSFNQVLDSIDQRKTPEIHVGPNFPS